MWSPDRRWVLLGLGALAACGFTPVYGPQGGGSKLLGSIALPDPEDSDDYAFNLRFEERMGRASGPYALVRDITVNSTGLGSLADGTTTRYQLTGRATYALMPAGGSEVLISGRTDAFTGYSVTGSSASRQASQSDARQRLMILLADQVIDRLLLDADELAQ
ncbi:LPS assembly lipoprotein LptE [Salipiger sp. 1_MG-2023]|uniref:LPS assembly lipoprotein LptE n=1 Tax=Salipiger sp. 1_MG-2023 TaxID=3062665 RepID=UPI0026E48195|nr:LPS assembly lipoprotein LptE [Salipiger sp. 1_MG-2023]MDO6587301.1 LPS assembly lipoprotein LptE [Salipiger sp. 1_MG-2023]